MRVLNLITATICLSLVCPACGRSIERRSVAKTGKIQETVDGKVEVVKSKIVALFKTKYEARVEGESDIYSTRRARCVAQRAIVTPHSQLRERFPEFLQGSPEHNSRPHNAGFAEASSLIFLPMPLGSDRKRFGLERGPLADRRSVSTDLCRSSFSEVVHIYLFLPATPLVH